jgi:Flp pilus assembly protein TadG
MNPRLRPVAMGSGDRGSASVELVLITPLLLVLLLFTVGVGRLATAQADVDGAARDAARAASTKRDPDSARRAAQDAAAATLGDRRITCTDLVVATDTSAFRAGGWVAVSIDCSVGLGDLSLLHLPGTKQMTARFVHPLDAYRGTRT